MFPIIEVVVLLVSYFPTLLLWSISWSSIFSSPLSSPLNFIPLLFVDLLCSDILQRVRERVDSSQNYANTRWSSFKPFSLFFLLRKHLTLPLQWPPAVSQGTQTICQSFSCFKMCEKYSCFPLSSQLQTSTAQNKTLKHVCHTCIRTEHV